MKITQDCSPPKRLYKFVGYDRICEILTLGKLLASKPTGFNDPFDCKVNLIWPDKVHGIFIQDRIDRLSRIVCFTKKPPAKNILMWAHYANEHKGVCLEFDMRAWLESPFNGMLPLKEQCVLKPVLYNSKRPAVNLYQDTSSQSTETLERLVFTKHVDWKYEQEWRMLFSLQDDIDWFVDFPPGSLKRIYLGLKMPEAHKQTISDCLAKAGYPANLIKVASENSSRFGLDFNDFD